jgi:hypothetical protein
MVAFHIQRGASVPLSASQFYAGLRQRFIERDGMFFLPDQVPAYDKARLEAQSVAQLTLFVSDEKSSIQWLRQQVAPEFGGFPQTYQELQPQFLRQLHQLKHEALPELSDLLEQNFLQDDDGRWYMPDPNKAPTWKSCGKRRCCGSSTATGGEKAAETVPHGGGARRLRPRLGQQRVRHHRPGGGAPAGKRLARGPGFVDVLR